jgi:hypothetical protein
MIRDGIFHKASSSDTGNCVEVAAIPRGGVCIRDSKDPNGPTLGYTDGEWRVFIASAKRGEFDLPE